MAESKQKEFIVGTKVWMTRKYQEPRKSRWADPVMIEEKLAGVVTNSAWNLSCELLADSVRVLYQHGVPVQKRIDIPAGTPWNQYAQVTDNLLHVGNSGFAIKDSPAEVIGREITLDFTNVVGSSMIGTELAVGYSGWQEWKSESGLVPLTIKGVERVYTVRAQLSASDPEIEIIDAPTGICQGELYPSISAGQLATR